MSTFVVVEMDAGRFAQLVVKAEDAGLAAAAAGCLVRCAGYRVTDACSAIRQPDGRWRVELAVEKEAP